MKPEEIQSSVNRIQPNEDSRLKMFGNIRRKAACKKGRLHDVRRFLPLAACFCLVILCVVVIHAINSGGTSADLPNLSGNPMQRVESAEKFLALGIQMDAPSAAEAVQYTILGGEIATIDFSLDGVKYTLCASKRQGDFTGIYGTVKEKASATKAVTFDVVDAGSREYSRLRWRKSGVTYYLYTEEAVTMDGLLGVLGSLKN